MRSRTKVVSPTRKPRPQRPRARQAIAPVRPPGHGEDDGADDAGVHRSAGRKWPAVSPRVAVAVVLAGIAEVALANEACKEPHAAVLVVFGIAAAIVAVVVRWR